VSANPAPEHKPVGFKIAIVDDRMEFANADKFPMADSFYVDRWEEV